MGDGGSGSKQDRVEEGILALGGNERDDGDESGRQELVPREHVVGTGLAPERGV